MYINMHDMRIEPYITLHQSITHTNNVIRLYTVL
jgi:hypothetical protein